MNIIIEIWKNQPGKFFCLSTKSGAGNWKDHFFSPDEFGRIPQFIRDNDDKDIYFCPHGFNRRVRQKAEAVMPNLLWADLDFANPTDKNLFKGLKPSVAIESSPGRYVGLWNMNEPMTEELNRRLSYHLGADKGGWDLTQVLRFPGTRNYKYRSQPKVRVLWDDGPTYSVKRLNKWLPKEEDDAPGEGELDPAEVFEEYAGKLPRWVRRELMAKNTVGRADRSEMLWKIENSCVEAGMTLEEAFAVIKRSAWNKFAGRRNEDEQLRRELSKIVDNHFKEKPVGAEKRRRKSDEEESQHEIEHRNGQRFKVVSLKDIQQEDIDWLWWPYLARRQVSILEGDPGLGKSYLAQMVCGKIAQGSRIPCSKKGMKVVHGPVVYFDIENDARAVTKPRLEDNGFGDLENYYPIEEGFSIDDEDALDEAYDVLEQIKPVLVVFDTLNSYIGKADTHKASESTQAMNIFKQIAMDFNCSVLVLRHLTKGSGAAMYRGQGSVAFTGSARIVMSVGVDPNDTETRAMAVTKANLSRKPPALTFRIEERKRDKSEFIWGDFVELTSQEIMDAATEARTEGKKGGHMQDAMEFLEATIKGVAIDVDKIYRMAEKRSIAKSMLDRAVSKMNIKKKTKGKVTTWMLETEAEDDED